MVRMERVHFRQLSQEISNGWFILFQKTSYSALESVKDFFVGKSTDVFKTSSSKT